MDRSLNVSRERYRLATASSVWPSRKLSRNRGLDCTAHYGKDEGDRANMSLARETDLAQKSRDRVLLNSVDAALKRISEGTFDQCLNCEQEINAKRLEAIPWVRDCITCQELMDGAN
jgi:DnaK suppressor protein